jgi:hypothetical protein
MKMSYVELLSVDARCNWMLKNQADHTRNPIHNGVQTAWPSPKKESPAVSYNNKKKQRDMLDKKKIRSKVWHPKPKADDGKDDKS